MLFGMLFIFSIQLSHLFSQVHVREVIWSFLFFVSRDQINIFHPRPLEDLFSSCFYYEHWSFHFIMNHMALISISSWSTAWFLMFWMSRWLGKKMACWRNLVKPVQHFQSWYLPVVCTNCAFSCLSNVPPIYPSNFRNLVPQGQPTSKNPELLS